jgi:hypothetical protein
MSDLYFFEQFATDQDSSISLERDIPQLRFAVQLLRAP